MAGLSRFYIAPIIRVVSDTSVTHQYFISICMRLFTCSVRGIYANKDFLSDCQ